MAIFRPFKAVRPNEQLADQVAALPYDVMNSEEAREMVKGNPYSFLHVDKAEVDLDPSVDIYDAAVYAKASENLEKMLADGVNVREEKPVYKMIQKRIAEKLLETSENKINRNRSVKRNSPPQTQW